MIWDAGREQHESIVHIIYDSIATLADKLNDNQLRFLFSFIENIPEDEYDTSLMALVRKYSIPAIVTSSKAGKPYYYGLSLCWDVMQDDANVSDDIKASSLLFIKDFLIWAECKSQREPFMKLCIRNIKQKQSIIPTLQVLHQCILSTVQDTIRPIPLTIEWLDSEFQLVQLLLEELIEFKKITMNYLIENQILLSKNQGNSTMDDKINAMKILHPKRTYIYEVQERLQFLQFIFAQTKNLKIKTEEQVNIIWECFIENSFTLQERDLTLKWLETGKHQAFEIELIYFIFIHKLPKLQIRYLSVPGLALIQSYFIEVNEFHNYLKLDVQRPFPIVLSFNLIGLDLLWRIALECENEDNGKKVIGYLIESLKYSSNQLVDQLVDQGKLFIHQCMNEISKIFNEFQYNKQKLQEMEEKIESMSDNSSSDASVRDNEHKTITELITDENKLRIKRCLSFLYGLVNEFSLNTGSKGHGAINKGKEIIIKINSVQPPETFHLKLFQNDKLSQIRTDIAKRYNIQEENTIRLITAGKELKNLEDTLDKANIRENQSISFVKRPSTIQNGGGNITGGTGGRVSVPSPTTSILPIPDISKNDKQQLQSTNIDVNKIFKPNLILSDPVHFNQLFELLIINEEIALKVWDLLMLLPTNDEMMNKLKNSSQSSSQTQWNQIIDVNSLFKLLYTLQIIDSMTQIDPSSSSSSFPSSTGSSSTSNQPSSPSLSSHHHTSLDQYQERKNWCEWFMKENGVSHLLTILRDNKLLLSSTQISKNKSCIALLMKVIYFFITKSSSHHSNLYTPPQPKIQTTSTPTTILSNQFDQQDLYIDPSLFFPPSSSPSPSPSPSPSSTPIFTVDSFIDKLMNNIHLTIQLLNNNKSSIAASLQRPSSPSSSSPSLQGTQAASSTGMPASSVENKKGEESIQDDLLIINYSLEMILIGCKAKNELNKLFSDSFVKYMSGNKEWVIECLLNCKNTTIKENIISKIYKIFISFLNNYSLSDQFVTLFLHILENVIHFPCNYYQTSQEFYELINLIVPTFSMSYYSSLNASSISIIHSPSPSNPSSSSSSINHNLNSEIESKFNKLTEILVNKLHEYPIIEKNSQVIDYTLCGIFNLLRNLFYYFPTFKKNYGIQQINELFDKCLFEIPNKSISNAQKSLAPPPLCKNKQTRKYCFLLLVELVRNSNSNWNYLISKLLNQYQPDPSPTSTTSPTWSGTSTPTGNEEAIPSTLSNISSFHNKPWNYHPAIQEKAPCGFVGLENQGATCYMNSLMQQFFMIPTFREGLLSIRTSQILCDQPSSSTTNPQSNTTDPNSNNHPEGTNQPLVKPQSEEEKKKYNLLYQFKRLFSYLQESAKKSFDTTEFCNAYGYNNDQFNPCIQMDVDEFFNMFLEKVETLMKNTERKQLIQDIFSGKVCNQVISKECEHVSETQEAFNTLSLTVKGKASIEESLELFVEGDVLDGDNKYHCGKCDKKVAALRRICIDSLPNTLIVHMKRFEFDLELMRRIKVNDYCKFPFHLNLEPFTKEGLARKENPQQAANSDSEHFKRPPNYYQYELVGILVHSGTADGGHYYSFISNKARFPGSTTTTTTSTTSTPSNSEFGDDDQWYEFNDSNVMYFDKNDIPKQAFGGWDTVNQYDTQQRKYVPKYSQRINNAYMLFYQRVVPIPTPSDHLLPQFAPSSSSFASLVQKEPSSPTNTTKESAAHPQQSIVPLHSHSSLVNDDDIYTAVWEENKLFLRDIYIFDSDYFTFIIDMMKEQLNQNTLLSSSSNSMMIGECTVDSSSSHENQERERMNNLSKAIELGCKFFIFTLSHSKDRECYPLFIDLLQKLFEKSIHSCKWFLWMVLKENCLKTLLFECVVPHVRFYFIQLVLFVFKLLSKEENQYYLEYYTNQSPIHYSDHSIEIKVTNKVHHNQTLHSATSLTTQLSSLINATPSSANSSSPSILGTYFNLSFFLPFFLSSLPFPLSFLPSFLSISFTPSEQ